MSFFKIYMNDEERGSAKYAEDAAAFVAFLGDGAVIKTGRSGKTLWAEGFEEQSASESYDHVAEVINDRLRN